MTLKTLCLNLDQTSSNDYLLNGRSSKNYKIDYKFLKIAISLGYRNLGSTWPNPSVGCVIVKNNHIVGVGNTAYQGRPHAEKNSPRSGKIKCNRLYGISYSRAMFSLW